MSSAFIVSGGPRPTFTAAQLIKMGRQYGGYLTFKEAARAVQNKPRPLHQYGENECQIPTSVNILSLAPTPLDSTTSPSSPRCPEAEPAKVQTPETPDGPSSTLRQPSQLALAISRLQLSWPTRLTYATIPWQACSNSRDVFMAALASIGVPESHWIEMDRMKGTTVTAMRGFVIRTMAACGLSHSQIAKETGRERSTVTAFLNKRRKHAKPYQAATPGT